MLEAIYWFRRDSCQSIQKWKTQRAGRKCEASCAGQAMPVGLRWQIAFRHLTGLIDRHYPGKPSQLAARKVETPRPAPHDLGVVQSCGRNDARKTTTRNITGDFRPTDCPESHRSCRSGLRGRAVLERHRSRMRTAEQRRSRMGQHENEWRKFSSWPLGRKRSFVRAFRLVFRRSGPGRW